MSWSLERRFGIQCQIAETAAQPSPAQYVSPPDSDLIEGDFLGEKLSGKKDPVSPAVTESSLLTSETGEEERTEETSTVLYRPVQTETPEPSYGSSHAGLVIGILLTVISLLIGAILYVVYQVTETKQSWMVA